MTAELGGQTGLCDPDETTAAFIRTAGAEPGDVAHWQSDADAVPSERHRFDASALTPQVAAPHSPANAAPVADHGTVKIDVAHIGACTGAKLVDLRMAASVLKGRKVDPGVSLLVAPASRRDQEAAAAEGTLQILIDAGATLLPNACGMCAGYNGTLAENVTCISSIARNFKGRMGTRERQHLSRLALHGRRLRRARAHHRSARDAVMSAQFGRAFVYGDGINTDMLAPGIYMKHPIATIAQHCLESVDPDFARTVRPGDVVVAGQGFGIGSSREQAAEALKHLGVAAVLARSYGGIFYRNALNFGLPVLVCAEVDQIGTGDLVQRRCRQRRRPQQDPRRHACRHAAPAIPAGHDRGRRPRAASRKALRRQARRSHRLSHASFRRSPGAWPDASPTRREMLCFQR